MHVREDKRWAQADTNMPPHAVSVATSDTSLVGSNMDRVAITVTNDGANIVYLSLGSAAVANQGVRLNASGGSYTTSAFTGPINAIALVGAVNVLVSEVANFDHFLTLVPGVEVDSAVQLTHNH